MPSRSRSFALPLFLLWSFAAGAAGALWPVDEWYFALERPWFTPPGWVFGPAWSTLYALIGVAAWRVWRTGGFARDRATLVVYTLQWALNFAWTGLFFGLRSPELALVEIVLLDAFVAATLIRFARHDRVAAWLLAPYLAWLCFATVLNFEFWRLNLG